MAIVESLIPTPIIQFLDDNGAVVPGGKLFTYVAGSSSTKLTTYTDATGVTGNANPIIADVNGRLNCWVPPGTAYKLVWSPSTDTDPPTKPFWTVDNLLGVPNYSVTTHVCEGRLTLTSGTPVTTNDVTGAKNIYFTPYIGDKVTLYDGTKWITTTFTEVSLVLPSQTQMNDIFIYNNAGTLTLEFLAWTNTTTRATAIVRQDGAWCKNGSLTHLYLGSLYTDSVISNAEDSFARRNLWNYYNRVIRPMKVVEATASWAYTTATFRQANGAVANQLECVIGVSEDLVKARAIGLAQNSSGAIVVTTGIGIDSTSSNSAQLYGASTALNIITQLIAEYYNYPGIGHHAISWLEYSTATGTTTWHGSDGGTVQSGIMGEVRG